MWLMHAFPFAICYILVESVFYSHTLYDIQISAYTNSNRCIGIFFKKLHKYSLELCIDSQTKEDFYRN